MSNVLKIYNKVSALPMGKKIFSRAVSLKAPYFGTINPHFNELKFGKCELSIKKRRKVENHLKSVHAIAMANMCELAGGICTEVTIPDNMRWIPGSMNIEYLKIARTDLRALCEIKNTDWKNGNNYPVTVHIFDTNNTEVVRSTIQMYITEKDVR